MPDITRLIETAKGDVPADLLLENCRIINLFSGRIKKDNIAISQGRIIGFGDYKAKEKINIREQFIAPAFIDGHFHIESSMLSPEQFAYSIIKNGTTTVIADPHEIVNVLGIEGLKLFINRSKNLPVDIKFMMPSCVPATHLETSAHNISALDMENWLEHKQILGLGEMMNFPGVIYRDSKVLDKINLYKNKIIDGHAPLLTGKDLSAYLCAGISSDHECSQPDEVLEKLEKGMFILIREGSAAKNLEAILPIVNSYNSQFFGFCTDDRHPDYLMDFGHINQVVKKAISLGLDPILAFQLSSVNTARHYGLNEIGSFGIGKKADFVVFDNFENIKIKKVFKNGKLVVDNGNLLIQQNELKSEVKNSVNIPPISKDFFVIKNTQKPIKVIEIIPNQIITKKSIEYFSEDNEELIANPQKDILKISVIERHRGTGNGFTGFVKGLGLQKGAISSTVAHDSHNFIVAGTNDADMHKCLEVTRKIKGGLVAVCDGEVLATLPLPLAGIMSEKSLEEVRKEYDNLLSVTKSLGSKIHDPFMTLSFLALPVIPELKITDKGLVDVNKFDFVSIYGED